jgi:lysophospholipase L1-like esterase
LPIECFAYGTSGYGTLQQLLFLQQHIDSILPDLLVLQMCTNDFIDNHYELAMECMYEMHEKRPYVQADGKIVYKVPLSTFRRVLVYLKFPEFVYKRIRRIMVHQGWLEAGESKIASQGMEYPIYASAVKKTEDLLQKIIDTLPSKTSLIVFSADAFEPQLQTLRKMVIAKQITFVDSHIHKLREAEGKGKVTFHQDRVHWSPEGHKIVANALAEEILTLLK